MAPLVFLASFCLMLIQIVSGRALAPFVGTSVYAWTGVIGTTLIGIIIGSACGGMAADRVGNRGSASFTGMKTLGLVLAFGGMAALAANYLILGMAEHMGAGSMPLLMRVIVMSTGAFFPAAFFLSMVSPLAAKLSVHELSSSASTVGRLSAVGALGNILGTLSGGYILIALIGTKAVLSGVAFVLIAIGMLIAGPILWRNKLSILVAVAMVGDLFLPAVCHRETNYYCIRVQETYGREGQSVQILRLDHLVHSYVNPADPLDLGYDYEREYASLIASRHASSSAFTAFFIGGGGYVLPRYLEAAYPQSSSIVAEIDPGVTKANFDLLGLSRMTRTVTANEDARMYLVRGGDAPYDLVFGDAFNDFSVPTHLTTVEFHRLLKSRMKPEGVYALNIIDDPRYGQFLASMIRTLSAVWSHVEVDTQTDQIKPGRNTIVLLASDTPLTSTTLKLISQEEIATFLKEHPTPVLTDDFAPTDRYLAPVFSDAY